MNFKEFYNEQTVYDILKNKGKRIAKYPFKKAKDAEKYYATNSPVYQAGKDVVGGTLKALNPFGGKGILGKTANKLKQFDNYLKGSGKSSEARAGYVTKDGKFDIGKWRQEKIVNRYADQQLLSNFITTFNVMLPAKKSADIRKIIKNRRNKPINDVPHIAMIVMDEMKKQQDKDLDTNMSLNNAISNTLTDRKIATFLTQNKLLPKSGIDY